jgi:predicted DNA-binding transcriptional regulator YafY
MDIMKYGSDVEVLEPIDLREKIINLLQDNLKIYKVRS